LRVALVEREIPETTISPTFDGRVSAIAYGTARWWGDLGVWDVMEKRARPILDIRIVDSDLEAGDSKFRLHYDHRELGREPMGWIVENRHIRSALLDAARAEKHITWHAPENISNMEVTPGYIQIKLKE